MGPVDFIIIGVVVLIVALATWYVIRAKKNGAKCIGCPSGCNCSESGTKGNADESGACSCGGACGSCGGSCGCGDHAAPSESSDPDETK